MQNIVPAAPQTVVASRDTLKSIWRGTRQTCPACGKGHLFRAFLKVADRCDCCGEDLHHHRADDAPAYFTMVIVGHVVIGGLLAVEKAYAPSMWLQLAIWLPLTVILSLALLQPIKGALVGLQWALRMHGFGGAVDTPVLEPVAAMPIAGRSGLGDGR